MLCIQIPEGLNDFDMEKKVTFHYLIKEIPLCHQKQFY